MHKSRHELVLRTGVAVLALATATALGGCSDSSSGSASAGSAAQAAPHTSTAHTRAPGPPAERTAPLAAPSKRCTTADLAVTPAQHQVKDGLEVERFTVTTATTTTTAATTTTTTSAAAAVGCLLTGTPNLVPRGPLSAQVPGATVDLAVSQLPVPTSVALAAGDGATIPLLPGHSASFYLAWFSASTVVCVQSNGFGFNAPGDTTYTDLQTVPYPVGSLCDGIFYVSTVF